MEVDSIPVLLITANVGSVFEDPSRLLNSWIKEFLNKIALVKPHFLALHLQEVGGKTYEKSMEYVQEFIRILCESEELSDYNKIRVYSDEDYNSAEHFTALGNLYFVHHSLQTVKIWNFLTHEWETADGKNIYTGNIESIATKEKAKFPQHFFPECKWSRKGFLRTRWELNSTVIDLVNIHLFHDASNLAACEEFPSVYCKTRRRALVHTLERFHRDNKNGIAPYFVFGDFNFRCDTEGVVKKLTEDLTKHRIQNIKNDSTKMHYKNSEGQNVLIVGKKEFNHSEHQIKFKESWLQKFDKELEPLREILVEYPITFAPTYPYEEDPEMPKSYMSTRCPAWCDRILMNPAAKDLIVDETFSSNDYNIIGENICMGDHKPIYLSINLKTLQGTKTYCNCYQEILSNEHANNFYNNFSSFLFNYDKIIIPKNYNFFNEIPKNASSHKYCLYLNKNFVDILIECRKLDFETAKKLNACIENVKYLCKNYKSSPGNILLPLNAQQTTKSNYNINNKNMLNTKTYNKENNINSVTIDKNHEFKNDEKIMKLDENEQKWEQKQDEQPKPRISINITNTDEGTVDDICMCSHYLKQNDELTDDNNENFHSTNNLLDNNKKICSQCQNIIKLHSNEPRLRLISKRLMLSNNIIVNRIDTQYLNTANFINQFESYTPESAESHSPCPEYAEYSMDDDINVIDILNDNVNNYNENDLILENNEDKNLKNDDIIQIKILNNKIPQTSDHKNENELLLNEINDPVKNTSIPTTIVLPLKKTLSTSTTTNSEKRGIVSPIQLKSRLEILQRKSLENGSDISVNNGLLNSKNNENSNSSENLKENVENKTKKNSCFDKCCAIS